MNESEVIKIFENFLGKSYDESTMHMFIENGIERAKLILNDVENTQSNLPQNLAAASAYFLYVQLEAARGSHLRAAMGRSATNETLETLAKEADKLYKYYLEECMQAGLCKNSYSDLIYTGGK